MVTRNEGTLRRWRYSGVTKKVTQAVAGGACRRKDGRALRKGSLEGKGEKGERGGRARKRTRTEELKGGVTTPCRMQNRGSIIVIERRHYRGAQKTSSSSFEYFLPRARLFAFPSTFFSFSLFLVLPFLSSLLHSLSSLLGKMSGY